MPEILLESALLNPPPDKPSYVPFPELAQAIRSQTNRILDEWRGRTLFAIPALGDLPAQDFKNSVARILAAMADALESSEPPDLRRLVQTAPAHGFQRFMQEYDLADLFAEERVLRRVIVSRVEEALARQCRPDEATALHGMIDIMLQQGVLALVQQQKQDLRHAAETQLKYLSFLCHDLSNNFLVITANLQFIEQKLAALPQMRETSELLNASLAMIRRTREGMRALLEHERLRNSSGKLSVAPVNLHSVVDPIATLATSDAQSKGLRVQVQIDREATVKTNADLLTIILQNLLGNAVKHTDGGNGTVVRVVAEHQHLDGDWWIVSVIDNGPGIPKDQLDRLFDAFQRLLQPGEKAIGDDGGFGLGLAIASQAAKLLGSTIEVKTQVGKGSTFSLRIPATAPVSSG